MPAAKPKPLPRRHVVIGTAGHIDHGKTELVKLLTGCDTDRLPEEKRRGMSIELGFAPCKMWSKHLVGIVDVPGHEKFVRTMVAGAAGIDFVMLVVAADDGIMPQTVEHMQIMGLLGIQRGLVALTKIDRVPPDRIEQVQTDLRAFLRSTFLTDAAICPLSPVTGEGYEPFWETLNRLIETTPERSARGVFRMSVVRVFSSPGYGTVATGVPCAGRIRVNDPVEILPARLRGAVRDLQVYQIETDEAAAGECVALNIHGVAADQIARGHVVAAPDTFQPATLLALRIHHLPTAPRPLKSGAQVQFHTGTSETPGKLHLLDAAAVEPGQSAFAHIRLAEPVVALPGDRYILRLPSPVATVAGGVVLESLVAAPAARPRREAVVPRLRNIESSLGHPVARLLCLLDDAGDAPLSPRDLARRACLPQAEADEILADPEFRNRAVTLGGGRFWMSAERWEQALGRLRQTVRAYHDKTPLGVGIARTALSAALALDPALFEALARAALDQKILAEEPGDLLRLADFRPALNPEDEAAARTIERALLVSPLTPPSRPQVLEEAAKTLAARPAAPAAGPAKATAVPPLRKAQAVLARLIEQGIVVVVEQPDLIFHRKAIAQARHVVISNLLEHGDMETPDLRDKLGVSRKYALPLLDYFDREGLTLRVESRRRLREAARRRIDPNQTKI